MTSFTLPVFSSPAVYIYPNPTLHTSSRLIFCYSKPSFRSYGFITLYPEQTNLSSKNYSVGLRLLSTRSHTRRGKTATASLFRGKVLPSKAQATRQRTGCCRPGASPGWEPESRARGSESRGRAAGRAPAGRGALCVFLSPYVGMRQGLCVVRKRTTARKRATAHHRRTGDWEMSGTLLPPGANV